MHSRRASTFLSLFAAAALLGACNSAAGTASPTATGGAATQGPAATAGSSAAAQASADVGGSAAGLAHLSSYKFTLQTTGATSSHVEATIVNGATPAKMYSSTTGSRTFRVVEIGNDVWVDEGSGTYIKNAMPVSSVDALIGVFDPVLLMANMQKNPEIRYLQNVGTEQKNSVNATHLHADQNTTVPAGASPIPVGSVFDVWVAVDGGYLVALEATGLGAGQAVESIQLEVTNVNDPTLSVSPPA